MRHVNYLSDFILRETFRNSAGEVVDISDFNVSLEYRTSVFSTFIASKIGDTYTNCYAGGMGELYIRFDNHNLARGYLSRDVACSVRSGAMPDGSLDIHLPDSMNIELWQFESDMKGIIDSEIIKDYNKGDKGDKGLKGDTGEQGTSGVAVSVSAPTDPCIKVWLNPNGKAPEFATKQDLEGKQNTLESGVNIKTINGTSILGEGDIPIGGGGPGTKGDKGDPGEQGKSAYQIAVEKGFSGTEQQWLLSLKGESGSPGIVLSVTEPDDQDVIIWIKLPFGS